VVGNFDHTGGGSGLLYVPFASFFDAAQIVVLLVTLAWLHRTSSAVTGDFRTIGTAVAITHAFVWISAMPMRVAHHWAGVPFWVDALLHSGVAQGMLSFVWTLIALALMIAATREALRQRWFVGFGLLGIVGAKFMIIDVVNKGTVAWTLSLLVVGLLILAASYFTPAPPRSGQPQEGALQ
jgi:uncharacterized membrane protein